MALSLANQKQYLMDFVSNNIAKISGLPIYEWIQENKLKSSLAGFSVYMTIRYIALKLWRRIRSYPPGPVGIPIFGYFIHRIVGNNLLGIKRYGINEMADKYGPIYMRYSMSECIITFADSKLSKKVLALKPNKGQAHILNRDKVYPKELRITANSDGVMNFGFEPEYDEWTGRRKLAQNALISMCTSSYISNILDQMMYKTIFPELDKMVQNSGTFNSKLVDHSFIANKQITFHLLYK